MDDKVIVLVARNNQRGTKGKKNKLTILCALYNRERRELLPNSSLENDGESKDSAISDDVTVQRILARTQRMMCLVPFFKGTISCALTLWGKLQPNLDHS